MTQRAAAPAGVRLALFGTLFVTALSTLVLEILLTRVLSVVMWYHFTFAVISMALLGIAAGAMHGYQRVSRGRTPEGIPPAAFWADVSLWLLIFSIAVALPVCLVRGVLGTPTVSWSGVGLLVVYFVVCATPFYASGYLTTVLFRYGVQETSSLYALDLLGGALGCLVSIPLLDHLGGIGSLCSVSVLTAAMAAVVAFWSGNRGRGITALLTAGAFIGTVLIPTQFARVDLRTVKLSQREEKRPILDVKWNSHSRLAMVDLYDPNDPTSFPFLTWGLSERYHGKLPRQYLITIDGGSETPVTELGPDVTAHEYLSWDVTSLPHHLHPKAKTLVIGAGGGRDLLTALWFGSTDVTGVELNRDIVAWVRGRYADFAGHLYDRPDVHVMVDDGRNFVRASTDRYDVLQISMIDTFAASAAGAYSLSENNLYTAEAFDEYLNHLSDDGMLSIVRFFLEPEHQTLRVVTMAREALARRGIAHPEQHIAVVRNRGDFQSVGIVIVKKTPFTAAEVKLLQNTSTKMAFVPVALPGVQLANPFNDYLAEADPERFYQQYPFDVRPPTDDRPFFFNTFKTEALLASLRMRDQIEAVRVYNFDAVFILFVLLALAGVCLLLFIFLPLVRGGTGQVLPGGRLAYFVWVGLGFILVEVVLIQRFNLYLGHPIYSLAVIMVSLLAFSGVGSALSGWLVPTARFWHAALACAAVVVLLGLYEVFWPIFLQATLGLPLPVRIALTVLSLWPIGLSMGMPYPLGLRSVTEDYPDGLPWVWAVNGAASVLGSIVAFALALATGFRVVFILGAICYLGALLCTAVFRASKPAVGRAQVVANEPVSAAAGV